ncbi:MAG: hypothetical protein M3M85_00425 [bacterium]|nr:hypothetical protein [bacterium]
MAIKLKTGDFQQFKGGRVEIENGNEKHLYVGEPATLLVDDGEGEEVLRINFAWLADAEGYPSVPVKWVKRKDLDYEANLAIYQILKVSCGCVFLRSWMNVDNLLLHRPTCHNPKLEPYDVEGLDVVPGHDSKYSYGEHIPQQ